jgi:hypothetical protein
MTGVEIAWRTLRRERVGEPCIIAAWVMKREFYRRYAGVQDIYADPVRTSVEAFANAGCNLNPQFLMPSPLQEHIAADPSALPDEPYLDGVFVHPRTYLSAEDVRDELESMPEPAEQMHGFDGDRTAREYAEPLLALRRMSGERTLYIGDFGIPSFYDGYTRWSYESYLSALAMYPDHFRRFFRIEAEKARLRNEAICHAMRTFDLAPVVYYGDDICFNDGPVCSLEMLDDLYFPALERAIQPLIEEGIDIVWHCDGNVLPIVPRLLALGIAGFQGFQEREANLPLATMASFRRRDGSPLILWGSVSVVDTFPRGSPDDVRRDVERCFRTAGQRGFCLASSSSILPETPMENIEAFVEHGRRFGKEFLGGGA